MPVAGSAAGDFDPCLFEIFGSVARLLGHIQGAVGGMSRGHGPGWRGGPWERGFGPPKSAKEWPPGPGGAGGFGGARGGWRPRPPGAAHGPEARRGHRRAPDPGPP